MTDLWLQQSLRSRAIRDLSEGAAWGGTLGLIRGVIRLFRDDTSWSVQTVGSKLVGMVVGSVICCTGRAFSGKFLGAWVGAVVGMFARLFIGEALGGYQWTTVREPSDQVTVVGRPVGQMIGSAIGAIVGAASGALADRVIRETAKTKTRSSV